MKKRVLTPPKPGNHLLSKDPEFATKRQEYLIEPSGTMFKVCACGGGVLPKTLRGLFQTKTMAAQALKSYIVNSRYGPYRARPWRLPKNG